jgi:hypothetical protein
MKQTAVELLVQEINKLTGLTIAMDEPCVIQAKEMEKEQIIKAYEYTAAGTSHYGEEYYNETFNK